MGRHTHHAEYRGLRWVTVACKCGWVSEGHRSRGEAHRAYEGHVWLAETDPNRSFWAGVDARRREPRGE